MHATNLKQGDFTMKSQNAIEHRLISLAGNAYCPEGLRKLADAICKLPAKYVDNRVRGCKTAILKTTTMKKDE